MNKEAIAAFLGELALLAIMENGEISFAKGVTPKYKNIITIEYSPLDSLGGGHVDVHVDIAETVESGIAAARKLFFEKLDLKE